MTDTDLPQELIELNSVQKDREYVEKLCLIPQYREGLQRALNYELVRAGSLPMSFDSFLASVTLEVASNEKLAKAVRSDPSSFLKSISLAAQLKLLVGSAFDLFYLIPRWNKEGKYLYVSHLTGYKGLCDVAQRHPRVHKVEAFLVYDGEEFDYNPGAGTCHHKYDPRVDRSEDAIVLAYSKVVITDPRGQNPIHADPVIWPMTKAEILARRAVSDSWKQAEEKGRRDSFWHLWPERAYRKTAIRGGMSGGSIPKDMGLGHIMQIEDADDLAPPPSRALPKPTVQASIREGLGIDKPPDRYETQEEAVAALDAATTKGEVDKIADGCQHFEGDATIAIAAAYDRACIRVEGDDE